MTTLNSTQVFLGCLAETVAFLVIWRIWARPGRRSVFARLFWSVVLLIPLFGVVVYFFITGGPEEHPYDTDTMRGGAESHYQGGDHH
jgi:hypothetical protein